MMWTRGKYQASSRDICVSFTSWPEKEQCFKLFDHLLQHKHLRWYDNGNEVRPQNCTSPRIEAFLGRTIGTLEPGRQTECGNTTLKVNHQPRGSCRDISWCALESDPMGRAIKDIAEAKLRELLPKGGGDAVLQCNVNLYTSKSKMPWHRDDCTVSNTKSGLPEARTDTFEPAAITCLLFTRSLSERHKNGPIKQSAFALVVCPDTPPAPIDRYGTVQPDFALSTVGDIVAIYENEYLYGVHTAQTGWDGESSTFERMSLNFRLVKTSAWNLLREHKPDLFEVDAGQSEHSACPTPTFE
jgi:hypothetical protein